MGTRAGGFGNDGDGNWFDRADAAEHELALEAADERLPWLESDDDGDEPPPFDTGRLVGLGVVMIAALIAIVGAIWLITNRSFGSEPAPDGSVIAAPSNPYKERPDNPGGKVFAGTGDTSYAVGAGQAVEGTLATNAAAAPPVTAAATPTPTPTLASATPGASATPARTPEEPRQAALPAGTAVQVGAYSTRADAEAGWQRLTGQTDALAGVSHRVVAGRADIGTVYRLQAVGGDKAGARALCSRLKDAGVACQVK